MSVTASSAASISDYLAQWAPRIEAELERQLPSKDEEPTTIHAAMRYSMLAGGKRLRPALVLLGAEASGGDAEGVLGVSCAVECVHTYSLIHDDLPAMDDDDLRRGRPSCHKQFGEALAILAGDALNTLAFELLVRTAPDPGQVGALVAELCRAAGTRGMVGGQVADLASEGAEPELARVRAIHERKTGALLASSLRLGAIAVGAPPALLECLGAYGARIGLAFQIIDDVLDEEGLRADLGKTPGKDRMRGKLTYPAAVGMDRSRQMADDLISEASVLVDGLPNGPVLASLGRFIVARRT